MLGASGLLAFSQPLGAVARGVKVTAFPWAFEAGCARGLGQGTRLALAWGLMPLPSVFYSDLGVGAAGSVGVTGRGERELVS